ncbi:MAG TPA: TAT-variant-translocated molybdopterin oxidoreductase [Gemmatimonadales bacterium]|nr:TAT-variant-translocated molybdopterin oxidoreductase [Gemmatimonadales bacterium]
MGEGWRERWEAWAARHEGREYWRGLDELLDEPEFTAALAREFPAGADELRGGLSRREFVKLLGASMALAGVSGCVSRPTERILTYVSRPPEVTPGTANHYATSMAMDGYATGLLVESHVGRPTKVEGNPDHPASLGAAGVYHQASVLELYDPHRAREVRRGGKATSWDAFAAALAPAALARQAGARGAGLHLLLEPTASPMAGELLSRVRERYPDVHVHFDAPLASDAPLDAARAVFGRAVQPVYDFRRADVVLALDANFLAAGPFFLRYARQFAERRRLRAPDDSMNRLYVVEGVLSETGASADHRLRGRTREVRDVAAMVHAAAASSGAAGAAGTGARPATDAGKSSEWVRAAAADLAAHRGRSIVIAGERQPAAVHATAYLLNAALGNEGRTVSYIEPQLIGAGGAGGARAESLAALVDAMRGGSAGAVIVLGGDPCFTAPADYDFARLFARVPFTAYLGLFRNETGGRAQWFASALHYLEAWGDERAWDGTASLVQPLIAPLYGGHARDDVLALVASVGGDAHTRLRDAWRTRAGAGAGDFDAFWDAALEGGVIEGSAAAPVRVQANPAALEALQSNAAPATDGPPAAGMEIVFAQSAAIYDGRFADNAWLQELPDPITKLTWDNAAQLSPRTASQLGVETNDVLELTLRGRSVRVPALVVPGHAHDCISVAVGYGRAGGPELVANGVGANVYRIRPSDAPYAAAGLSVRRAPASGGPLRHVLATTQSHWGMHGRSPILAATLEEYRRNPSFAASERKRTLTLYEPSLTAPDQWAMAIDLSLCTGCSACVVACQAENNIPVVGREGVLHSREMHWIRIDRYFSGAPDDPATAVQPMLCQQCEKAPCEYVCPVGATSHSVDGINEMVYNRCVGTRFCSNNCPYKVRRFNWFDYNDELAETERMVKNPDVTVRARGVMEKCTFCIQRVREAQIAGRVEGRPLRPGEVRTACQQSCPTEAIIFGSLTNPRDEVVRRWADPRRYEVLHELSTQPRVQYLARISNPNPALGPSDDLA